MGYSVTIICENSANRFAESVTEGVRILSAPTPLGPHLVYLRFLLSGQFDVAIEDLAHVVPWFGRLLTRKPVVTYVRHLHSRTLPGQVGLLLRALFAEIERLYPVFLWRTDTVVPSTSVASDVVSLGVRSSRIHVIGYGVDRSLFLPREKSEQPEFVYFAGFRPYKRADHALWALKQVVDNGLPARLTFAGDGPTRLSVEALSTKLGLSGHVRFVGKIPDTELASLVSRSWAHIQCSKAEGWGLSCSEAAACGTPTVAYSVPGLQDSVLPGKTGFLVEDGNPIALGERLIEICRDPLLWSRRCLQSTSTHDWSESALQWSQLLDALTPKEFPACEGTQTSL